MIRSHLCYCSDEYIHVKGTITIRNTTAANNANKKVIFKNCAPFTNCIIQINNTQVDDAHDIDVVMSMYNLIEHSDTYLKTLGGLWNQYRDEQALDNNNNIVDFLANNNDSISFKFKHDKQETIAQKMLK